MDNRRLILLLVFTFSLVMLWDAWQKFNQPKPGVPPVAAVQAGGAAPQPSASLQAATTGAPAVTTGAPVAPKGETVTVKTDVFTAEISTQGGDIVRLELNTQKAIVDKSKNFVLFDPSHQYIAQSGLIGDGLPNHKTLYAVAPGPHEMVAGADSLQFRLTAPAVNGVKVTKVFTFHRGSHLIDIAYDIDNGGQNALAPHAYYQLVRDEKDRKSVV